jgi:hypothetical protein
MRRLLSLVVLLGACGCDDTIDLGGLLGDASSPPEVAPPTDSPADTDVDASRDAADGPDPADGAFDASDADAPTDGAQNDTDAPAADADAPAADTDASPRERAIFVTRAVYRSTFGGVAGADFRCQSSATAAGLSGTFRAWISDSTVEAGARFRANGPWVEIGTGRLVFRDRAALRGYPAVPLERDEGGREAPDRWWTGTLANGVASAKTCNDWVSESSLLGGMTGTRRARGAPGQEWTEDVAYACGQSLALLCLEDE